LLVRAAIEPEVKISCVGPGIILNDDAIAGIDSQVAHDRWAACIEFLWENEASEGSARKEEEGNSPAERQNMVRTMHRDSLATRIRGCLERDDAERCSNCHRDSNISALVFASFWLVASFAHVDHLKHLEEADKAELSEPHLLAPPGLLTTATPLFLWRGGRGGRSAALEEFHRVYLGGFPENSLRVASRRNGQDTRNRHGTASGVTRLSCWAVLHMAAYGCMVAA
jgi:hypothetical protein